MTVKFIPALQRLKNYADWKLLIFLILFLNVKLAIKIPAVILIYALQPNFNFGFRFKNSRLPIFYLLIIGIPIISWIINKDYHYFNYTLVCLMAIGFWLLCLLAAHQIKYRVEHTDSVLIHHAILIFFALNAIVSFLNIAAIICETGAVNPYVYQGQYQKYFISTGDYIRGITLDTSTTNAFINAFGVIYFFTRKNIAMLFICMVVLLLTCSNFINIIITIAFGFLFFFRSDKNQKSLIFICLGFLAIFMIKVSPHNNGYAIATFKDIFFHKNISDYLPPPQPLPITAIPDNLLTPEERREKKAQLFIDSINNLKSAADNKIQATQYQQVQALSGDDKKLDLPKPDINTRPYQTRTFTDAEQQRLLGFIDLNKIKLPLSGQENYRTNLPGKYIGLQQTLGFFKQHPTKLLLGDGAGNFSSKLAFRASGLGFSGGYPAKYTYISPEFLTNHLDIYLNFFSKRPGLHSLTNSPSSTFDQLFAEYGLLGLLAFLIGYLWFFIRQYRYITYGLPILMIMTTGFFVEYWFEQLSIIILFELLLFLDIKDNYQTKTSVAYA